MEPDDMDRLVKVARETWEQVVSAQGRKAEWVPKMMVQDDAGHVDIGAMVGGFDDSLVLATALDQLVTAATAWAALTVDSYITTDSELTSHHRDRPLSELYALGHPSVLDALVVVAVHRDGRVQLTELPYRVRGREVHWFEERRHDSATDGHHIGGRLGEALVAVMSRRHN
jgi:hypothetical protein